MNENFILFIDKVEWSDSQNPAKTTIEGDSLLFKPSIIGVIQGNAKGYLSLREVEPGSKMSEFSVNVDWACQVAEIILRILVNDKPFEPSEIFRLGEYISCSYEAFKPDGSLIDIQQAKWSVEEPALVLFSEDTWKPDYLDDESLQEPSVEFTLFTFDQEKNSQKVSLAITYLGIEKKETIYIPFLRPKYIRCDPITHDPDLSISSGSNWLGLSPTSNGPGFELRPIISNTTGINYDFMVIQTLQNYHTRFSVEEGHEEAKTYPIGAWWGDLETPYNIIYDVPSEDDFSLENLFEDSPGVELDGPGINLDVRQCSANATYSLYLFAKPSKDSTETLRYWCPIAHFYWGYSASAEKKDSKWTKTSGKFYGPEYSLPKDFPTWIKTTAEENIEWKPINP